jgi:Zn-dependent protease with chaperone function
MMEVFPGAEDFPRRTRQEEFQSVGGIPLPFGDIPGTTYARYSFHRGWLDFGLLRNGIQVAPPANGLAIVVIHYRAYRVTAVPPSAASIQRMEFPGMPDDYGYLLLRVTEPARIRAFVDTGTARRVLQRFLLLLGAVLASSLLIAILVRAKLLPDDAARAANLLILLATIYILISALGSENVLAVAFYYAGRLAVPAALLAVGLTYILGRFAYYPAVRAKMSIPFYEYSAQVLRQVFVVTAPILAYLFLDSFLDILWVSLAVFGVFFVVVTLLSPMMVRWLFHARALNAEERESISLYSRRHGARIRAFYEYTPRYTFSPNAFVAGVFPFNRALFVSTHLLGFLTPEERESVMAHELAHARFHHPFWLFALTLGYLGAAGGLVSLLPGAYADLWMAGLVLVGALLFFAVSRAFERQADRAAASEFGNVYLSAIRKLYSTAPETGTPRFEYLLTHPSQRRRFEAIEQWISSAPLKSS